MRYRNLKKSYWRWLRKLPKKKTSATVYTMYQREYMPDCSLAYADKSKVDANVKKIYQDINSYTNWLKWKKEQEENGEKLKWSKWYKGEAPAKKNNDDCYLLRE